MFFNLDTVTFSAGPANRNITLNTTVFPKAVLVDNSAGNDYTISGTGGIGESGFGHGTVLIKSGAGTLTLGVDTYSETATVQAGLLRTTSAITVNSAVVVESLAMLSVEASASVGGIDGGGAVTVGNGADPATLSASHFRQVALSIRAGGTAAVKPNGTPSGTSAVATLAVNGTSRLDLNNNDLVVRATAATKDAVHGATEADIVSAQNGVDINFVTNWNGPGITSSSARTANVTAGFDLTGLGVIRNSDLDTTTGIPGSSYTTFSGQAVAPDDVLVKYTYVGDANLSGAVSFDDYVGMDNAFFELIPNLGWATGDINLDGVINFDDYSKVDQAFFFQAAPLSGSSGDVAAVPEPATWLLTVLGLVALVLVRRRAH
jgi:hypothetical protein